MAFTYILATNVGKVRFEIGDTVEDRGVRPNRANFSEDEIEHLLALEGTTGRAAARAAEILVREWSSEPIEWKLGPESEKISAVEHWQSEANRLRETYGYADADNNPADGLFDWYDPTE